MRETAASALPKVAFLGPLGTYSHQSAHEKFGDNVEYVEEPTISAVFKAVSSQSALYGVVPQENSTFGSVVEMYDNLRQPSVGTNVFVKGEVTISIQHCMVVRTGVKSEEIKRIVSHEQALGQCANYLSTHYPNAVLQKMSSTGVAAQSVLCDDANSEESEGETAAICSSLCAALFDGLEIIHKNIQDLSDNFTRFYVLSSTVDAKPPYLPCKPQLGRGLIRLGARISEEEPPQNLATASRALQLIVSTLLTTFGVPITRVDRRPSLRSVPFEDVYFAELEELGGPPDPNDLSGRGMMHARWLAKVQAAVERARASGIDAILLGIW